MITPKTLIIPSEKLDPDLVAATLSIARVINLKGESKAEVFLKKERFPAYLSKVFPDKDIKFVEEIEPQGFVVKLKSIDAKIRDIKWEEVDGEINLYISADKGKLDRKASVKSGGTNYTQIITIGIQSLEELGETYIKNKELFSSVDLINIDLSESNNQFGKHEFVKSDASSFSEIAFEFLSENGLEVTSKEATDLISGIVWRTRGFKTLNKSSIFLTISELINKNGDLEKATKQIYQTLNLNQLRYLSTVLKNAEISSDGIIFSIVRKEDTMPVRLEEIVFPELNLLSYFEDAKIAIVLTEISGQLTHCNIISSQKGIKASKIASTFGGEGTSQTASLNIQNSVENAKIQILNEINGANSKVKTAPILTERQEVAVKKIDKVETKELPEIEENKNYDPLPPADDGPPPEA